LPPEKSRAVDVLAVCRSIHVPITFHPGPGAILICRYGDASPFQPPEMMKTRPVVVISPRRRSSGVVSIVPLSSSAPHPPAPWHWQLSPTAYPPARAALWAKGDMIATVALARLDRVKLGRNHAVIQMPAHDYAGIQNAVRAALGL
jgi:uncharacterized protein YifN (PemK superfamily)